jgi:hypothetical protein
MTEKDIDIYYKTILDLVSLAGKVCRLIGREKFGFCK